MASRKIKSSDISKAIVIITAIIVGIYGLINYFKENREAEDKPAANADTEVHFVDIGQGDATLVLSGQEAMLIDTGERDEHDVLVKYLQDEKIKSLKYLIITHPHSDHMGEAGDILENFDVENIIMPKVTGKLVPTSSVYKKFLKTVQKQGKKITAAKDESFRFGNADVELFTPKQQHSDLNNISTLVKISHGDNSFLITGDCGKEEEKDFLQQKTDLSAKVLKVGHHGSRTSSSDAFLKAVNPYYAVISCGKGNDYGHPHEQAVKRIKKYASHYYCTMDCGSIVFLSDGRGLTVKTEKQ